uniref:Protein SDA1 n=1 Tax=Heterorhabditis bacteriophora TaxID=37862 RepID=A0A1I7W9P6_HETBA
MASTDAQLLAPEEMKKREKGLRQRRKKKNKQRAMVMIMGENAIMEQKRKKDKHSKAVVDKGSSDALKSSTFFNKLQDTVQEELKEKTTRKKKVKSEVVLSGGSKFKL